MTCESYIDINNNIFCFLDTSQVRRVRSVCTLLQSYLAWESLSFLFCQQIYSCWRCIHKSLEIACESYIDINDNIICFLDTSQVRRVGRFCTLLQSYFPWESFSFCFCQCNSTFLPGILRQNTSNDKNYQKYLQLLSSIYCGCSLAVRIPCCGRGDLVVETCGLALYP